MAYQVYRYIGIGVLQQHHQRKPTTTGEKKKRQQTNKQYTSSLSKGATSGNEAGVHTTRGLNENFVPR